MCCHSKSNRYFLIGFLLLLWGCISTYRLTRPELVHNISEGSKPELFEEATADSGQVIYTEFSYRINPAVELKEPLKNKYTNIRANLKLVKMKKDGEEVFGTVSVTNRSITYLKDKDLNGAFDRFMVQARKNSTNWKKTEQEIPYRQVDGIRSETGGFQMELIYHGLRDSMVTATYREYIDDLTRASSVKEISCRLARKSENILTFNGARINIIEATPQKITYKVEKGFNR